MTDGFSGAAPQARLGSYDVFAGFNNEDGTSADVSIAAISAAATNENCDILSMSCLSTSSGLGDSRRRRPAQWLARFG